MKKLITALSLTSLCLFSTQTFAASSGLTIYSARGVDSKVVEHVADAENLIPQYRRRGWVYVYDRETENSGWIEATSYQDAMQTTFDVYNSKIRSNQVDADGNPQAGIVTIISKRKLTPDQVAQIDGQLVDEQTELDAYTNDLLHKSFRFQQEEADLSDMEPVNILPNIAPVIFVTEDPTVNTDKK